MKAGDTSYITREPENREERQSLRPNVRDWAGLGSGQIVLHGLIKTPIKSTFNGYILACNIILYNSLHCEIIISQMVMIHSPCPTTNCHLLLVPDDFSSAFDWPACCMATSRTFKNSQEGFSEVLYDYPLLNQQKEMRLDQIIIKQQLKITGFGKWQKLFIERILTNNQLHSHAHSTKKYTKTVEYST